MSKDSHYLPLTKVTEGMVLAENLLDKVGHILLPVGTTLTTSMLNAITHHQVYQLCVQMDDADAQEVKKEQLEKLARVERLFRSQAGKEPASTLKQYLIHYREGQIQ
ncbi:hypothetical protein [Undibacterium sp. RuRC25W]|uniref:hypothetical protein n=1 Tax=Undibacterium sp. RuRC25W TaxID=3413047 RepID=UPI003BF08F3A